MEGKPIPDWLYAGGGVGTVEPDATDTVTENLEPGTYYVVNTDAGGPPDPKTVPAFEVTGEASKEELPETDAIVRTVDYGFESTGLKSGENQIRFENAGAQPHHIIASPLVKGTSLKAAKAFLLGGGPDRKGRPVVQLKGTDSTAVIEGGDSQNANLDARRAGRVRPVLLHQPTARAAPLTCEREWSTRSRSSSHRGRGAAGHRAPR